MTRGWGAWERASALGGLEHLFASHLPLATKSEQAANSEITGALRGLSDQPTNSTSPPSPLSIGWSGGTGGEARTHAFPLPLPPLHPMERGNGGEAQSLLQRSASSASH